MGTGNKVAAYDNLTAECNFCLDERKLKSTHHNYIMYGSQNREIPYSSFCMLFWHESMDPMVYMFH